MQIDIHAQNLELNPPLRAFIEEKMASLDRLLQSEGVVHARVEVGVPSHHHRSGDIYYAEANLTVSGGHLLRAQATNYDLHSAIVDVKDDLKVQIKKFKDQEGDRNA